MRHGESGLLDLESLIRDVLATRVEVDDEVVARVRSAMRVQPEFSVRVVVRALRLEQMLRRAQQELIRLQWELAQLRRGLIQSPPAREDED